MQVKHNIIWCNIILLTVFFCQTNADMMFGGITVVCGILGTLAGGFVLDYMTNTLSNAFKVGI